MKLITVTEAVVEITRAIAANWWVEIVTADPRCIYFFGPFDSIEEAREAQYGYIEDLTREGAYGIAVNIKRCNPKY